MGDDSVFVIIMIAYFIWAIYSGWKFMNGRVAFLEQEGVIYKLLKFICAYVVGLVYGMFYLILLIFKAIRLFAK